MRRRAITVRELVVVVALIALVAAGSFPFIRHAWRERQEQLGRELADAIRDASVDQIEALLARRADVNWRGPYSRTPLQTAVWMGRTGVAEVLLAHGAHVNVTAASGETPLHWVAHRGHTELVELLLAHGADPDATTVHGQTPLHLAAANGFTDVAESLIAHGADVNATDSHGVTPLGQARIADDAMRPLLEKHGATE